MNPKITNGSGGMLIAFVLAALACGPAATVAIAQGKTDVSGKWLFQVETSAGSGSPVMTFKQDGEMVTGTYEGQLGTAPLKGTVKGQSITFTFMGNAQGETVDVMYEGTIDQDSMKGTLKIAGDAVTGTFTAKRQ
ncbi:MAG: hypothetical protein ABR606_10910 [Vicinamibacterales bacterium]